MSKLVSPKAPIDKCPHCGSLYGYYTKNFVQGRSEYYYNFDGSETDNSNIHDHLIYKHGKIAYCVHCDKKLFNMSETEEAHP